MLTLPNYQISTQIHESANSLVYRGLRKEDNQAVILKVLKQDYPTPAELTRYRQEYETTHDLHSAGIIKVYDIEKYQNTLVIILEDFGGESLRQLMADRPFTLTEFLPLAIQIANSLGKIHTANIIHKDINPSNIVWEPVTKQLKIIDFGIASRLPRENPTLKNPEQLEGTLAYLSPEQTGRINRSMDYRTDLYSLGITFYEMLTGKCPFEQNDAMELVHCHIAKTPSPACEVNPDIPAIVSNIIMKLLAKNAEERYQSAFGIKADLEKIQENLTSLQSLSGLQFELAQNDFSGQLQIPQKLYGREHEINTLLQAFDRVSQGSAEMMLIAGYSGVGKTALVHEIHKPMTEKRGYFATGKFDQFQTNIPYFAITQAFNKFCRYLLMENATTLANWQTEILEAVGNNGQVIIDVIPDLELVIGQQPTVAKVGPTEAQNRLQMMFLNFVKALGKKEHPFILFIDDLQWVDAASLDLLKNIILEEEIKYLLILGAYRDNEVNKSHPVRIMLDEIQKTKTIQQLLLKPLESSDINLMICETIAQDAKTVAPLARLIKEKTEGNPFFVIEFLKTVYAKELISFDFNGRQWHYDLDKIKEQDITDNVVELVAGRIVELPLETQAVLKLAACIGNKFSIPSLSVIYKHSLKETIKNLWPAINNGLVIASEDFGKLYSIACHHETDVSLLETMAYETERFLHDRVQQAAYSLIPEDEKKIIHLTIARLLFKNCPTHELSENIFDIINHYNQGINLITEPAELLTVKELNLLAGKQAKNAAAFFSAKAYLQFGLDLLDENSWQDNYSLTFDYYRLLGEVEFFGGHVEKAFELIDFALAKAQTSNHQVLANSIKLTWLLHLGQYAEATTLGIEALNSLFNLNIPKIDAKESMKYAIKVEIEAFERYMSSHTVADLEMLPSMQNEAMKPCIRIMTDLLICALNVFPELVPLLSFKLTNLTIKYGLSEFSACNFSLFALAQATEKKNYQMADSLMHLALNLVEKHHIPQKLNHYTLFFCAYFACLKNPIKQAIAYLKKSHTLSLEMGDLAFAQYSLINAGRFLMNVNLENALHQSEVAFDFQIQNQFLLTMLPQSNIGFIKSMKGETLEKSSLEYDNFTIESFANLFGTTPLIGWLQRWQLASLILFEQYTKALPFILNRTAIVSYLGDIDFPFKADFNLFCGIGITALYQKTSCQEQQAYQQILDDCMSDLRTLAELCFDNFGDYLLILQAEQAKISNQPLDAIKLYTKAIELSDKQERIQNKAIANELNAKLFLSQEIKPVAAIYMQEARYAYEQWGASAKAQNLAQQYLELFKQPTMKGTSKVAGTTILSAATTFLSTGTSSSNLFDISSIIKASQTLSGEIVLSRLLNKLMHIVIENAGAERGLLILEKEKGKSDWTIEAEGILGTDEVTVLQSIPLEGYLPIAIINYVVRTGEPVVLANAIQEGIYTEDSYIRQHQLKSVLCSPILHQGQLIGLLYLENNVIESAFTEARLKIVDMLSSQAAISLENALLYRTLEQKVKQRTQQLADANQKIMLLNERLKEENLRMGAELDVAQRLQQMVLPKETELQQIESLDIACFMEPADEVGGDYYDILEHNGHLKIGIGDVTGHGLESGVLMLMVQTAVRSLLISETTEPIKFLKNLNRIIYDNVQRMGTDKNLTLSLLDYQDGQLQITGQHEEILLVHQDGQIEPIDTFELGFSVGVINNIANFVSQIDIELQPCEGIVLYTDGITEARNLDEKQYGIKRLYEVVSQNWHLSAKEIQQAVIDDVRQFIGKQKVFDDITLLVLKQK